MIGSDWRNPRESGGGKLEACAPAPGAGLPRPWDLGVLGSPGAERPQNRRPSLPGEAAGEGGRAEPGEGLWGSCARVPGSFLVNKSGEKSGGPQPFSLGERLVMRTRGHTGRPSCWCSGLRCSLTNGREHRDRTRHVVSQNTPSCPCYCLSGPLRSSRLLFCEDGLCHLSSGAYSSLPFSLTDFLTSRSS